MYETVPSKHMPYTVILPFCIPPDVRARSMNDIEWLYVGVLLLRTSKPETAIIRYLEDYGS